MQIGRLGFTEDDVALAVARRDFAQGQCAVLTEFLAPDLTGQFLRALEIETFAPVVHHLHGDVEFGRDLSFSQTSPTLHALLLLLNNPRLFSAVQSITGCAPIGCFAGRIYRNPPSPEFRLNWHDDMQDAGRLIGLSISLTPGTPNGGEFRIRRKSSLEVLAEVRQAGPGNAHIFQIDSGLEHSVAPVEGEVARTAFAGWFQSAPDHRSFVQGLFAGRDNR